MRQFDVGLAIRNLVQKMGENGTYILLIRAYLDEHNLPSIFI